MARTSSSRSIPFLQQVMRVRTSFTSCSPGHSAPWDCISQRTRAFSSPPFVHRAKGSAPLAQA